MSFKNTVKDTVWNLMWNQEWNIGFFRSDSFSETLPKISWLKSDYNGGWFADPFILNENGDKIEVLVEEFHYSSGKGRIDLLTINSSDYTLEGLKVLLDTRYHLSFPAIFRTEKKTYIYPENSEEGVLRLYEYNESSKSLIKPVTILKDNVVDAIIRQNSSDNLFYLYATKFGSLQDNADLLIYQSDTLKGEYRFIKKISLGNFGARGAGNWIDDGNRLIRPSQDGSDLNRYGKGIILSEFTWNEGEQRFQELNRINPSSRSYPLGVHTINQLGTLYVVDGLKFKRSLLGSITWDLKNFFQKVR